MTRSSTGPKVTAAQKKRAQRKRAQERKRAAATSVPAAAAKETVVVVHEVMEVGAPAAHLAASCEPEEVFVQVDSGVATDEGNGLALALNESVEMEASPEFEVADDEWVLV